MDLGRVFFIFFSLMSLTSVIGYLYDQNTIMLFIAVAVNFISTTLKIGVKNTFSSELLASSIVADLHLIPAFLSLQMFNNQTVAFSLVLGALAANLFSVALMLVESSKTNDRDSEY